MIEPKQYRCIETLGTEGVQVSIMERLRLPGITPSDKVGFWHLSKDEAVKAFLERQERQIKLLEKNLDDARKAHRMATLGKFDMHYSEAVSQAIAEKAAGTRPMETARKFITGEDAPASWRPPGLRGDLGNAMSEADYRAHVTEMDAVGDASWNKSLRQVLAEDDND